MKVITKYSELEPKESAISIGFFDGVHKGHATLLRQLVKQAKARGLQSVVITFSTHPREALHANYVPKLLTINSERVAMLEKFGIDVCLLLPFDKNFSDQSSKYFMKHVLVEQLNMKYLLVGYDHHFGNDREHGYDYYKELGESLGVEVEQFTPYQVKKQNISSSFIRKAIEAGDMVAANEYLGYPYFLEGSVVSGYKIGRTLGFPTANIAVSDVRKLLPKQGVYAVRVKLVDSQETYNGMLYIGVRPTVVNQSVAKSIEVHLFDFEGDIYHQQVEISFLDYVRDENRFDSLDSLANQLHRDMEAIQEWFAKQAK